MADPDTLRRLWRYKSDLEEGPDEEKLIQILKRLYKLHVSISSLQETGIGKVVNSFRHQDGIVGEWAKKVVATWKTLVGQEVKKDVPKTEDSSHGTDLDSKDSDASQDSWTSWDGRQEKIVAVKQEKEESRSNRPSESKYGGDKARSSSSHHHHRDSSGRRESKDKHEKENRKSSSGGSHNENSERRKDKERQKKEHRERSSDAHSGGSRSSHSHQHKSHHSTDIKIKQEKKWECDDGKRSEKKEISHKKESKGYDEDLTDSDAETEQPASDVSSIEQYYKAMLGQVEDGKSDSKPGRGHDKSERSKSYSDSRSEKYSKPNENSNSKSGDKVRSGSHSSSSSAKRKSEDNLNGVKHLKVDRKRKNHSLSESDDEEEEEVGEGKENGDERLYKKSHSKHEDSQSRKHHDSHSSSQKTSSSSHQKSSSSTSKSHKSSLSSSSSHHSKSSSHHKSSPETHSHSKSSSSSKSSASSSHQRSSSHTHSSKSNGNSEKHHHRHHGDKTPPPYSPNPIRIKTEKDDIIEQSSALYNPTPITDLDNHHHFQNNSDECETNNSDNDFPSMSATNQFSSSMTKEKHRKDRSESEHFYEPKKQIKSEKMDNETFNFESDSAYIPTRKIKKEKEDSSAIYSNGKEEYNHSEERYKRKGNSGVALSEVHRKNKYLESVGRIASEDGDEERYSPTHGWKVKDEKTLDDHMYGGGRKRHDSESDVNEDSDLPDINIEYSSRDSSSRKEKKDGHGEKLPLDSSYRKGSSTSGATTKDRSKSRDQPSTDRSQSSKHRSEESRGREKDRSHGKNHQSTSSHDKKHVKHDNSSNGGKDKKHHSSHRSSSSSQSKHHHSSSDRGDPSKSVSTSKDSVPMTKSTSSSSASLLKTSSPSNHTKKKKSKPKVSPDTGADFNLFSETIQIESASSQICTEAKKKQSSSSSLGKSSSSSSEKSATVNVQSKHSKESVSKERRNSHSERKKDSRETLSSGSSPLPSIGDDHKKEGAGDASKVKKKKEALFMDDSAMSFDDFLNFDESAMLKKSGAKVGMSKSSPTKKLKKSSSSSHLNTTSSDRNQSKSGPTVPLPSSNLTVTESDIMSLLPATQAYYRPIRQNPIYQDEEQPSQVEEEFDPDVIGTKSNIRYKLYSGKKHVIKELKSLHDLCLHVLMDHIDDIDHVGPIPYFILKPVLERCTPQQLYRLEDHNPHFIEDSEELWEIHSKKEFMGSQRQEMETWRELFLRRHEEREAKYQKLKANMSMTISKGQAGRPARLAYVDTVAKPPREVLRQQKRHGTGRVVRPNHKGNFDRTGSRGNEPRAFGLKAYKPSPTVPAHNPMADPPRTVLPTPPMMARALQMRKNMRR